MILPKGTTVFSKNGGEKVMEETIDQIRSEKRSGYLLVTGSLDNDEGNEEEITAQLLFEEGEVRLCESKIGERTHKGKEGIHTLLKSMMKSDNTIEMRSKIDVGPPMAFFKECRFEPTELNIQDFKKKIKEEEERKRQKEEDKRKKKEKEESIKEKVESWISSGYKIESYPKIMDENHEKIIKWYNKLNASINEISKTLEWIKTIDDVELKEIKDNIVKKADNPMLIDEILKLKKELEEKMYNIVDKRAEMKKWVNLWKDEGYNTEHLEETLNGDIDTAWNNLTHFMDDIQRLKDHREELENLKNEDTGDRFGPEIREIDLLLNDPQEIDNIIKLIWGLKETMGKEAEEKEALLGEAKKHEDNGYDISQLASKINERLETFKNEHQTFMNNITNIEQMKDEAKTLNRRDIPEEIDNMVSGWTDPFELEKYQKSLEQMKEKLEMLNSKRNSILSELDAIKKEGFVISEMEEELEKPLDKFTVLFEDFKGRIKQMKEISSTIDEMDHRWLEERFQALGAKLKDVKLIDEVKKEVADIKTLIDQREKMRSKVKEQMDQWESRGFDMEKLKAVIEDDQNVFEPLFKEISEMIKEAETALEEIDKLNVKYFPAEAEDLISRLKAPGEIESAIKDLEGFKKRVSADWDIRNRLHARMDELKEMGFNVDGMEQMLDTSPNLIEEKAEELEGNVRKLNESLEDIEKWDTLESNWYSDGIDELKTHLRRIMDVENAMEHYNDLRTKIDSNMKLREEIRDQVNEWKELGFITRGVIEKFESPMEELKEAYDNLDGKMRKLQELQDRFDSLDFRHFKSEAEEIEFKMNDPYMLDEIEKEILGLEDKINEDQKKRQEYRSRITDYMNEGFMGSEKLEEFMEEDLSIVDLEFKNFDKEVQLFRKYMESTGFVFPGERKKPLEKQEDKEQGSKEKEEKGKEGNIEKLKANGPDDSMTFEDFVVGSSNEMAYNAAFDVAGDPVNKYNPLVILGDKGLGKSHLLSSIYRKLKDESPKTKALFMNGEQFLEMMRSYKKRSKMEDFRDIFRNSDLLIMDDTDHLKDSEEGQEMFINIMNSYLDNGKQVVIASERDIKSMPEVADHIRARLDTGKSVDLEGSTPEFNKELLEKWSGKLMTDEVKDFLANNLTGPVSHVKLALDLFEKEVDKVKNEQLKLAKEIVDRISGDQSEKKLAEALEDTLSEILDKNSNGPTPCSNCQAEIPAGASQCPSCGAEHEEKKTRECPVCKTATEIGSTVCPNCSFEFN